VSRHIENPGSEPSEPHLEFGFRGEDITYRCGGRVAEISFTYMKGPRIYTDSMDRWKDGTPFTAADRREVLGRAVALVRKQRESPTIVINVDDPAASDWKAICQELRRDIAGIEMTSDAEGVAFHKKMLMDILAAGKGVTVNGERLRTEADIDRYLANTFPPRSTDDSSR
jgi:hypothetical protein